MQVAVVTGTGGIGREVALRLAQARFKVIVAGRNPAGAAHTFQSIKSLHPDVAVCFEYVDLADLQSVAQLAARVYEKECRLDVLVNNAGVMMPPSRRVTREGFELQFATNYLGHFALTSRLMPLLRRAPAPRVVSVSSLAHRRATLNFDDLQFAERYRPFAAYAQSKLAQLMFAFELQRHSDVHGWNVRSVAAHPGYARTDLIKNGPGLNTWAARLSKIAEPFISQSAAEGGAAIAFAALSPHARGGGYYGPRGLLEMKGHVGEARFAPLTQDIGQRGRLWEISQRLVGLAFSG
jgi:NAD(P)-dependent dehydrogenase (short-subunit alcohol dehydrogenase family)